jgi:hypothetical protein
MRRKGRQCRPDHQEIRCHVAAAWTAGPPRKRIKFVIPRLDRPFAPEAPLAHELFVTGTDTGVGKTHVTRLLLETCAARESTPSATNPSLAATATTPRILAAASGGLPLDE